MAWEAVSKANVAALSGVSSGQLQDAWYDMAVALIGRHAGIYNIGNVTQVVDVLDGNGAGYIPVRYPPISSVVSVYIDDYAVSSSLYTHDTRSVILTDEFSVNPYLIDRVFTKGTQNVTITYNSGSAADDSVALTVALIVKELVNINTSEGASSRLQFYNPGRTSATEAPLVEFGTHGKIVGIIKSLLGTKKRYA